MVARVGKQRNRTARQLTAGFVWFDSEINDYLGAGLARAMRFGMLTIRKIAVRSIKKHRRKRVGELTASERAYYAPQGRDDKGRFQKRINNKANFPNMPGVPGGPPRYSDAPGTNFRDSIYAVYDPQTESGVVGHVKLAGRGARRVNVPQLLQEGGTAPRSFGVHPRQLRAWNKLYGTTPPIRGEMVAIRARPAMPLAMAAAQSKFPDRFRDIDQARTFTD
jgi:hypothetical protein